MKPPLRMAEALAYAAELHAGQRRKASDVPYLAHLLAVTAIVLEHGADEDTAIAAVLHDAIEDQGGDATRQEIRRRFGERVTQIIDACTDAETVPKPAWRERKERHLAHLATAPPEALLVTAADKLHNALCICKDFRRLGDALWSRFSGGKSGSLWYYRAMADLLLERGPQLLAAELAATVHEIERLARDGA